MQVHGRILVSDYRMDTMDGCRHLKEYKEEEGVEAFRENAQTGVE